MVEDVIFDEGCPKPPEPKDFSTLMWEEDILVLLVRERDSSF